MDFSKFGSIQKEPVKKEKKIKTIPAYILHQKSSSFDAIILTIEDVVEKVNVMTITISKHKLEFWVKKLKREYKNLQEAEPKHDTN